MKPFLASLSAVPLLLASALQGQSPGAEGSFRVVDASTPLARVELAPEDGARAGTLAWSCGVESLELALASPDEARVVSYAIWQFAGEKADTTFFLNQAVRRGDRLWLTALARRGGRLTLRVLGADPGGPGVEHRYHLTGAAEALDQLPCMRTLITTAPHPAWPPPEGLVPNPPPPPAQQPAKPAIQSIFELGEVEERPVPVNGAELTRELTRSYPRSLRDEGVTGEVLVRFRVLKDGRVDPTSPTVLRSAHPDFDAVVLRNLPVLHFRPARVNGRPVQVWVVQPIGFALGQ